MYLKAWFWIDLVSILPVNYIELIAGSAQTGGVTAYSCNPYGEPLLRL